ncbi:expressed unknown protein [Seminavis robusta]|uniref:Uncharacterized protein n=1 Tax=Seminavis robusta TaxID=568900 RepID=A0A9N8EIQ2_9STRA|nr:expressed unknown protein [Seminavis robusta]|eukprot:Sro1199_g251700.1 n/a (159) ;mRNA; r:8443-8919
MERQDEEVAPKTGAVTTFGANRDADSEPGEDMKMKTNQSCKTNVSSVTPVQSPNLALRHPPVMLSRRRLVRMDHDDDDDYRMPPRVLLCPDLNVICGMSGRGETFLEPERLYLKRERNDGANLTGEFDDGEDEQAQDDWRKQQKECPKRARRVSNFNS